MISRKIILMVLCTASLSGAACPRTNSTTASVPCPRFSVPETYAHDTVVYRPDPAVPGDLLICALVLSSYVGQAGEDPYASVNPPAEPPLVYRYQSTRAVLAPDTAEAWRNAGTPVGNLWSSVDFASSLQLDHDKKHVVGGQSTTSYAGQFADGLNSSPKDPSSGRVDDETFGGKGSTHSALLTASRKDPPGILGSGGALREPFYMQVFSVPDGAQVGPTRLLSEGEEASYPPECGWTYDGRYIICYHPGSLWIIPTPEVLEAHAKKER